MCNISALKCLEMTRPFSTFCWIVYLNYCKYFLLCSNPDTFLILLKVVLPFNLSPVATTSGKVIDWREKSVKETEHDLFKTCYISTVAMVVPNPRLCLCLLWCHQIAHFILSLSCASNNFFPHFPPHHICILVYFPCPSEPSVTFFLWLCLSHTFSALHFVLSCTALCIIFLDGLKVFFLPRASCEIAVLYCVWSGRTTRLQSLSLSVSLILLFVCSEHFTRLRSLNCLWQASIQSHKYSMKSMEMEPLCIHVHMTRVKLAIIEAKTFLDVTFQLCV